MAALRCGALLGAPSAYAHATDEDTAQQLVLRPRENRILLVRRTPTLAALGSYPYRRRSIHEVQSLSLPGVNSVGDTVGPETKGRSCSLACWVIKYYPLLGFSIS